MAARSDRREQRRDVVVEILTGRRSRRARSDPLPEGQVLRDVPWSAVLPYAHHRRVQDEVGPRVARCLVQRRTARAAGTDLHPDELPGGAPAGGAAADQRGVRERGHQDRAQLVRQPPAPPETERTRLLVTGVETHLHGRRGAHHAPARRAGAVEAALHGVVARLVQEPARRMPGIVADTDQPQVVATQDGAYGVQVFGDGTDALHQGGGGRRAEFQLAAGLDGERRPQRHGPQGGVGRFEPFGCHGELRHAQLVDEPFHFDPEGAGRPCLEADAPDQGLHLGFGDRGTGLRTVATVTCRIGHVGILLRFHHATGPVSVGSGAAHSSHPRPSRLVAQGCVLPRSGSVISGSPAVRGARKLRCTARPASLTMNV